MMGPALLNIKRRKEMDAYAMIGNGVALQGEQTWNAVKELGLQTVSSSKQDEIKNEMAEFLNCLYNKGDLAQYGIEEYSVP